MPGTLSLSALGDLTLEAWEARRKELVRVQGVRESDVHTAVHSVAVG